MDINGISSLIICFGKYNLNGKKQHDITLPLTYPNDYIVVNGIITQNWTATEYMIDIFNKTNSGFTVYHDYDAVLEAISGMWLAVGY